MWRKSPLQLSILLLVAMCLRGSEGLRLENVHVPNRALVGADADLYCYFSLENQTMLYLKWFKDGIEFFRYAPKQPQPISLFWVNGINVQGDRSNLNRVHLTNLTKTSSGTYKCEVSTDKSFRSVGKEADMIILAAPSSDPELTGFPSSVSVGDTLEGNCTLPGGTNLLPKLSFYINGHLVDEGEVITFPKWNGTGSEVQRPVLEGIEGKESKVEDEVIGLSLQVKDRHWMSSQGNFNHLELKCVARSEAVDAMWVKVKIIQESHPTLRRASYLRGIQPVQEISSSQTIFSRSPYAANTNTNANANANTDCGTSQLVSRIADLVEIQNRVLEKLSNLEHQRLETEKESLSVQRQELEFLRGLHPTPAPVKST